MQPSASPQRAIRICLGICTYRRPKMLLRCLASVQKLVAPRSTQLSVIVVDNEGSNITRSLVQGFWDISRNSHPFVYVPEGRRGIAEARNAVLREADKQGAAWIAMLDDDQTVTPVWLLNMWNAVEMGADVVRSAVQYEMPDTPWAFPRQPREMWELNARHAATNGVLFRAGLAGPCGEPLRFAKRFSFTGGEDRDFFRRAWLGGARIIGTPHAVATETVPASRLTLKAQVARAYACEAVNVRQDCEMHGRAYVMAAKSVKFVGALIGALGNLCMSPLEGALRSRRHARKRVLRAAKQAGKATGIAVGLVGIVRPEPYHIVHGE